MYTTTKPLLRRLHEMLPTFCGVAVTCCALQAHADDYFNPALLDIDNPEQAKTDLSVYEMVRSGARQISGHDVRQ